MSLDTNIWYAKRESSRRDVAEDKTRSPFVLKRKNALDKGVSTERSSGRLLAHTPIWDSVQGAPEQEGSPEKLRK